MVTSTELMTLADVGRLFFVNDEVSINLFQPALIALIAPVLIFLVFWALIPSTSTSSYNFDSDQYGRNSYNSDNDQYGMTSLDYGATDRGGFAGPISGFHPFSSFSFLM